MPLGFESANRCPQIAMENMQGAASPKPLFKQLMCVNYFSYQCSESSHASEIEQVRCRVVVDVCTCAYPGMRMLICGGLRYVGVHELYRAKQALH